MIHNLTPVPTEVYMVYEIDFIPKTSPAARGHRAVRPIWLDVENGSAWPVFDVEKGSGQDAAATHIRTRREGRLRRPARRRNEWVADRDGVLIATAGHLHPGGLYTDLYLRRTGRRLRKAGCDGPEGRGPQALRAERAARPGRPGAPVPVEGQVLRAGGSGVLGRCDDRHTARLAREGARGRRALDHAPPTTPAARPGGSRWGS